MTRTEWKTKEEKRQRDFLWTLGPEATDQLTRSDYRIDPHNNKIGKLIKVYNR